MGETNIEDYKPQFYFKTRDSDWQELGKIEETTSLFSEPMRNNAVSENKKEEERWVDKGKFTLTMEVANVNKDLLKALRPKKQRLPRKMKKAYKEILYIYFSSRIMDVKLYNTKWKRRATRMLGIQPIR